MNLAKPLQNTGMETDSISKFWYQQRQTFADLFSSKGMPTTRDEEWKYTSLRRLQDIRFELATEISEADFAEVSQHPLFQLDAWRFVFINGKFASALSDITLPEGVQWDRMSSILLQEQHWANTFIGSIADASFGLNALNGAMFQEGIALRIGKGIKLEKTILLLSFQITHERSFQQQLRNLIVLEENASATIIESYQGIGEMTGFTNVVNEIRVASQAHLEHYKIQQESADSIHVNYTQCEQEAHSNIHQVTLTLDGKLTRNNLHFNLQGQEAQTLLYGLYVLNKQQFCDNHTRVDHAMPNCFSDEKYKGLLMDQSTAVFNGKIHVHPDAQKTNAYQRNQNILLSEDASIYTKPQLEIFADDVKCTHGATTGQLDEEPLFYLRSRGISEKEARNLLLNAYADEIAEKIRIPELVEIMENEIRRKL